MTEFDMLSLLLFRSIASRYENTERHLAAFRLPLSLTTTPRFLARFSRFSLGYGIAVASKIRLHIMSLLPRFISHFDIFRMADGFDAIDAFTYMRIALFSY